MVETGVDPVTPRFSGRNDRTLAESGGIARNPVETKHQVDGLVRSRALSPGTLWKTPDADKKRTSNGASCPSAPALDRCPRQSRRRTDISSHQRACSRRSAAGSGRSRTVIMRYAISGRTSHSSPAMRRERESFATGLSIGSRLVATERYVPIFSVVRGGGLRAICALMGLRPVRWSRDTLRVGLVSRSGVIALVRFSLARRQVAYPTHRLA